MVLEAENKFFDANRAQWLPHHEGKFALIHGDALIGVFDSPAIAYVEGVKRLGNVPLLIKPILASDPVEHIPALTCGLIHACT